MTALTNQQRIKKLQAAIGLIFEVEDSYPWVHEDRYDIRHDGYRLRIKVGELITRIKLAEEWDQEHERLKEIAEDVKARPEASHALSRVKLHFPECSKPNTFKRTDMADDDRAELLGWQFFGNCLLEARYRHFEDADPNFGSPPASR